jgi:methionine-rich copper-binding protein CopC
VFLFALTLAAAQGAAHSEKQATVPADGAIPAMSPQTIGMTFDMPLRVILIALRD